MGDATGSYQNTWHRIASHPIAPCRTPSPIESRLTARIRLLRAPGSHTGAVLQRAVSGIIGHEKDMGHVRDPIRDPMPDMTRDLMRDWAQKPDAGADAGSGAGRTVGASKMHFVRRAWTAVHGRMDCLQPRKACRQSSHQPHTKRQPSAIHSQQSEGKTKNTEGSHRQPTGIGVVGAIGTFPPQCITSATLKQCHVLGRLCRCGVAPPVRALRPVCCCSRNSRVRSTARAPGLYKPDSTMPQQ